VQVGFEQSEIRSHPKFADFTCNHFGIGEF